MNVAADADDQDREALRTHFERLVGLAGGPTKAARALEVSRTTLDQWIKGKTRIPLGPTVRLAKLTNAGLDWILGSSEAHGAQGGTPIGPVLGDQTPDGFVAVPMLDIRASAGPGLVAVDKAMRQDVLSFREDWMRRIGLTPGKVEALFVTGDSMHPTIQDGDMILIDRQIDRVVDGALYVLVIGGEVRVKRVFVRTDDSLLLRSDNGMWPEEVVSADRRHDLTIEGRVRWFGRTI